MLGTLTLLSLCPSFPRACARACVCAHTHTHTALPVSPSEAIRRKVELEWGTEDDEYLDKVERNLQKALQEHPPDVVVYNAGTDILEGDRLGGLSISPQVPPNPGGRGAGFPPTTRVLLLMWGRGRAGLPGQSHRIQALLHPSTGHREAG